MPPDWYRDPNGLPCLRYWDGRNWTDHTAPVPLPAPPTNNVGTWVALSVLLLFIVGGYIAYHSYRYQGCYISPGIFDWPNQCI